ncbi:hypothetical protein BKA82DRAFT_4338759 [Pisolithus tinctorius]|nr:hypothetical protein BKA82DRAFT_4338759 [Pisolithus tinctorius]
MLHRSRYHYSSHQYPPSAIHLRLKSRLCQNTSASAKTMSCYGDAIALIRRMLVPLSTLGFLTLKLIPFSP